MMICSNNNSSAVRLPAEWERTGGVLLAWPHTDTDWAPMLDCVQNCYIELIEAITRHVRAIVVTPDMSSISSRLVRSDIDIDRLVWVIQPTNDTWTRDYGPIVTTSGRDIWQINDFKFNGWGLKFAADRDNLVTSALCRNDTFIGQYCNRLGFVLEGGSIESDGCGTLLTTTRCLMSPNRNGDLDHDEIEQTLKACLGVNRVLWLDHGALEGDDTDSHIDTLARFAANDTIVYVGTDDKTDSHYDELSRMRKDLRSFRTADGKPYNLIELPLPDPIYDEDGNRLPATYANFLILNEAVLMPTYGQECKDRLAAQILKTAFPNHTIETVDCRAFIRQHGSLHCATMQLPYEILSSCPTPSVSE